jgi:ATP-dependent HslUV protease ATP-binding subunit HslU
MPELQGRLPIRVELTRLGQQDFVRILTEPENSLVRQYQALLAVDGVELELTPAAIEAIARFAAAVNEAAEDIGARRLATVLERLLAPELFGAPDLVRGRVRIDAPEVERELGELVARQDLARYIL